MANITELLGETTDYDKKVTVEKRRPKSWCKTVSAFANGTGGVLYFGVDDDDNVVGLEDPQSAAEDISEIVKARLDPIPPVHLSFETVGDNTIVVLTVSPGGDTPYFYYADGQRIAYERVGNQSVPCNGVKMKELYLKSSGATYDSLPSKYRVEDFTFGKLRATYKQRTHSDFDPSYLESFGLVDSNGVLTNAGALLADEGPVYQSRVFCTRWNGLTKASGSIDALDDVELSGGLVSLLQDSLNFVMRNSKKMWRKTADSRIEMPDYPERSVTEGLVNALIHRNYLEVGSEVHVDMFDDRLEIYSPGGMLNGQNVADMDIMNVPSQRRNPVLADVFSRLLYMERKGSGFKKIMEDYQNQYHYTEALRPEFSSEFGSFFLVLKNLNYENVTVNVTDNVTVNVTVKDPNILPKVFIGKRLATAEFIINEIQENASVTASQISEKVGLSERTVKRYFHELQTNGIIERRGSDKQGTWVLHLEETE